MAIQEPAQGHNQEPGPPCRHMEGMLNRAADNSAGRFSRWYAFAHAARCGRCGRYLRALEEMLLRLKGGKNLPPDDVMSRLTEKISELKN